MKFNIGDRIRVTGDCYDYGSRIVKSGTEAQVTLLDYEDDMGFNIGVSVDGEFHWIQSECVELVTENNITNPEKQHVDDLLNKEVWLCDNLGFVSKFNSEYKSPYPKQYTISSIAIINNTKFGKTYENCSLKALKNVVEHLNNLIDYYDKFDKYPFIELTKEEKLNEISRLSEEEINTIFRDYIKGE